MTTISAIHRIALILLAASLTQIAVPNRTLRPADETLALPNRSTESGTASLPVFFEPNRGQAGDDVRFIGRGNGFAVLLKSSEVVIAQRTPGEAGDRDTARYQSMTMRLEAAGAAPVVYGAGKQNGRVNYLIGRDQSKWIRDVETYSEVRYPGVYPGVDLVFHTTERQLEYDFDIAAGANPNAIRLRFDGAEDIEISADGQLVMQAGAGELRHARPIAYQEINGERVPIAAEFAQLAGGAIGFNVGEYDRELPLVIDPTLVFSSYLGGTAADTCRAMLVVPNGTSVLAGDSFSSDFLRNASTTNSDVFVGRLTPDGGSFTYTFFGGEANDTVTGLALDSMGNAYLAGFTESADFPISDSVNSALMGPSDAFLALINAEGNAILSSSLIGGTGQETSVSVALDAAGSAYLTGRTTSMDFPIVGAIQPVYGGGDSDAFVSKLSPNGASLVYSTYLGGSGTENLLARTGIRVDSSGNAYVVGDTQSADFPTRNALRSIKSGPAATFDGFYCKINPDGSDFVFSTFVGGSDDDFATSLAVDGSGNGYVTGRTRSTSFTGAAATRSSTANSDAFVAKFNAAGSAITYLTFVGGSAGDEQANAIAINSSGVAVIVGSAGQGLPTIGAIQSFFKGGQTDAFVARLASSGAINFSTYLGGSGDDVANGVGVDSEGHVVLAGFTTSADFLTFGALRFANSGGRDIFLARIDPDVSADGPVLLQVIISGKALILYGQNFDSGAKLRINDEQTKTRNDDPDPSQVLFAKKGGKRIKPGQTVQLQVVNASGKRSNLLFLTRPM
jgi:hypothetical protein